MSAAFASKKLLQLGAFHWARLAPERAGRVALGVVVPLAAGWMIGRVEYGAYMALGAFPAGMASFQGETRSRVAAVALASLGMAISTFVGASAAASAPWMLVPIIAFWGYITGLSICLGPLVNVAVLQWSIALLIAVGFPAGGSEAALRAGLVLSGGVLQAVLVAASWTLRPGTSERSALAASYRAMAAYASDLGAGVGGAPPAAAFPAGSALDDPNPLLPRHRRLTFLNLLEEAERIRASLAALATHAADHPEGDESEIRAFTAKAANALDLIGRALDSPPAARDALARELGAYIAAMNVPADVAWRWSGEALLGQLRAVGRLMTSIDASKGDNGGDTGTSPISIGSEGLSVWAAATLRANVTATTEAGRHALRLAAVTALAEVIVQATGLYQGRWATLTIFIVLRSDYASTFSRGPQRALGTILGAALGAGAVQELAHAGLIAAAGGSVAAAYALFDVNYLLFSIFLTTYILILLALLGMAALPTAEARIVETVIGAGLALAAYYIWPTWEGTTAQEKFARLIEAHRDYGTALLRELARPRSVKPAELRRLQAAARRARSDAEAATARLSEEPEQPRLTSDFAQRLMATASRLAHAELALHALAMSGDWAGSSSNTADITEQLDALRAGLDLAMSRIAAALRSPREQDPIPRMRPIYAALLPAGDAALAVMVDRLIDATDTLDEIVHERVHAGERASRAQELTMHRSNATEPARLSPGEHSSAPRDGAARSSDPPTHRRPRH
jgi:uncharacterized membrane protein YccC